MKISASKTIALVAHDNKKSRLIKWLKDNKEKLKGHKFYATGTTGGKIVEELGLEVKILHSGPLGGDQQIGGKIAEGKINMLIFFWDPLEAMSHDSDVKALLRIAAVWNIPCASNESTADFLINSSLFNSEYDREIQDFNAYKNRVIPNV